MGVFQSLSVVALRQLVGGACNTVGISVGGEAIVEFLTGRFIDHSQKLTSALKTANEQAWKSLEIALGGESWWSRFFGSAEDRAFRTEVQSFLDDAQLPGPPDTDFRRCCLDELRTARKDGLLTGDSLAPDELARQAGTFDRFDDPQAVIDAEWKMVERTAGELRERCPKLYKYTGCADEFGAVALPHCSGRLVLFSARGRERPRVVSRPGDRQTGCPCRDDRGHKCQREKVGTADPKAP